MGDFGSYGLHTNLDVFLLLVATSWLEVGYSYVIVMVRYYVCILYNSVSL